MSCQAPLNAYFEALLETGVDEMAWDDVGDDNVSHWRVILGIGQASHAFMLACVRVGF